MNRDLQELQRILQGAIAKASSIPAQPVASGKWTSAQILEHLFLTYKNTTRGLRRCLEKGIATFPPPTVRQRIGVVVVLGFGYLPGGAKSPERAVPKGLPAEQVKHDVLTELEGMGIALEECERIFGARTKLLDHPFLGSFSSRQWGRFHLVHGRHHARQIRERGGLVS